MFTLTVLKRQDCHRILAIMEPQLCSLFKELETYKNEKYDLQKSNPSIFFELTDYELKNFSVHYLVAMIHFSNLSLRYNLRFKTRDEVDIPRFLNKSQKFLT